MRLNVPQHTTFKFISIHLTVNQVMIVRVVMPCSVVVGYQRFTGPCCLCLWGDDRGSMVLQNVGILHHYYMATQPRRPHFESSLGEPHPQLTIVHKV